LRIIKPGFEIWTDITEKKLLETIEHAARTCYKSEGAIEDRSAEKIVSKLLKLKHGAMLEHVSITVKIVCDRGVSHEIVRHRIASYAQESTRYCNYSDEKFGSEITVIEPCFWDNPEKASERNTWSKAMYDAETSYFNLISKGATPQEARSVLPNSLKTEIVVTMNLREWLHFFELRAAKAAHPQMQEIAIPLQAEFARRWPVVFGAA
jgi:thymidylate synthase (FAD)